VAGILSISDRISYSVIFILFYINIYMFGIKIDFYRLIWLNKNIKKICDFPYAPNTEKCFQRKIFFRKMTSLKHFTTETILRNKQSIIITKFTDFWALQCGCHIFSHPKGRFIIRIGESNIFRRLLKKEKKIKNVRIFSIYRLIIIKSWLFDYRTLYLL
jgi:hypothetical protein